MCLFSDIDDSAYIRFDAMALGNHRSWTIRQQLPNGDFGPTDRLWNGYPGDLYGGSVYSVDFPSCRFPNEQYMWSPWFATDAMCDLTVSVTVRVYTMTPLEATIRIFDASRTHITGTISQPGRTHYRVTFNRPIKQALNMPINQTIFRGQGQWMVDNFPLNSFTNAAPSVNDSWTMLSADRRDFMLSYDVLTVHPPVDSTVSIPQAPVWNLTTMMFHYM